MSEIYLKYTYLVNVKVTVNILSIFVAFLDNINFMRPNDIFFQLFIVLGMHEFGLPPTLTYPYGSLK